MNSNIAESSRVCKGKTDDGPLMRRGEMYSRAQVIDRLKMSPSTLTSWEAKGLNSYGEGMKEKVYLSDDIFDFLRTRPTRSK